MNTRMNRMTTGIPSFGRGHESGFTLIELMIVITLVSVLMAIAAPSFKDFGVRQRVKSAAFDLYSALTLARSEAIKRNAQVTITKATNGWQDGWTVTSGASTISTQIAYSNITITTAASSVIYGPDGRLVGNTSPSFAIVGGTNSRCTTIDLSGLPKNKVGSC